MARRRVKKDGFDLVPLPPLPPFVWTPLGLVEVFMVRELTNSKDANTMGLWSPDHRTISIRDGMDPCATWQTFHHEDMHRMLGDAGVQLSTEHEEAVCDAYALAKVTEMIWRHD